MTAVKLLHSPTSPYARKVRVLALERGIELPVEAINPLADPPPLIAASPPGKVPVLVLDDGATVYDSRVICAYLEAQAGRPPPSISDQVEHALAESMLDCALPLVMERRRPSESQGTRNVNVYSA